MKKVSALLTFLLAALLTGPLPAAESGRSLAIATIEMGVAQGTASLSGDVSDPRKSDPDSADGHELDDGAVLPGQRGGAHVRLARGGNAAIDASSISAHRQGYQARAPPTV